VKLAILKPYLLVIALLLLGLALRLYQPFHTPFGFDQVQILEAAERIQQGSVSLIGPRTGPASMFTGPLIYYVTALFGFIFPLYWALVISAAFFSVCTGIAIWYLSRTYLKPEFALAMLAIWAASPFLISLDKIVWNPNLMVVAAAFAFFPLLKTKSLNYLDAIFLAVGVFLGYQAHFSGLLLLPFISVGLFIRVIQRIDPLVKSGIIFFVAVLGFIASITPTIIFDVRHDYLNLKGFLSLSQNSDQVSKYLAIVRFPEKVFIVFETAGKVLFLGGTAALVCVSGLTFFIGWLYQNKESIMSHLVLIPAFWIGFVTVLFSFYRESTPEYYFLLLVPVFMYLIVSVLVAFVSKFNQRVLFFVFLMYGAVFTFWEYGTSSSFDLQAQLETVSEIQEIKEKNEVTALQFDIKPIETIGIKYLLKYFEVGLPELNQNSETESDQVVLAIKYPVGDTQLLTSLVEDKVGLWLDSRDDVSRSYVTTDEYILSAPTEFSFYTISSTHLLDFATTKHVVIDESEGESRVVGEVYVLNKNLDSDKLSLLQEQVSNSSLEILFERNDYIFAGVGSELDQLGLVEAATGEFK